MFKSIALLTALGVGLIATSNAATAAATRIDCPVNQLTTAVTTSLPSDWWATPQVGRLQTTRIDTIGGEPTLMCGYWAYGHDVFVMKTAPRGAACRADATGFSCATPGSAEAPRTHSTGGIALRQTWSMDLDTGAETSGGGADVWFQARTATDRMLTPVNGAQIAVAGTRSVNLAGCRALSHYSTTPVNLRAAPVGTYICVKTDRGRISQFRINGGAGQLLEIGYTTWAN